MFKSFDTDRKIIENKYHKTNEPFDPYKRMAYHGYEYDKSTGLSDEEILEGLRTLAAETEGLPHPVIKARAIEYVLQNTRTDVNEHDYFIGIYSQNRLIRETTVDKWNAEVFDGIIPETRDMMYDKIAPAVDIWPDYDHVVPDWESLLSLGFAGIRRRASEYRLKHEQNGTLDDNMRAFFDAIDIQYGAICDFLDRVYRYARTQTHAKAKRISECIKQLSEGAPRNIYEAMQMIYIYFMISESVDMFQVRSLGNGLDRSLRRFYEHDLESGTFTRDEIRELLAYFLFQWSAIGNYWGQPFYLGGTASDGTTRVYPLTYDILDVYDRIGIYNPKIQIKTDASTPRELLNKIFDMIRRGKNSFVFCCEPAMRDAVMSYGATFEEACDMDIRGCYETGVRANEVSSATGYINALKPVEYALSNGYDRLAKKQVGLKTGELSELDTFEKFYHAVLRQLDFLTERTLECANSYERYFEYINPSSMYSATIAESLQRGRDGYAGGVKFNNSAVLFCGLGSLINSIMAVKEFVFDTGTVGLEELCSALRADWEDCEELRAKILSSNRKYGCSDPETNLYAKVIASYFTGKVSNRPNARGGVYKAVMHSAMQFVWQGQKTPATPDGRRAGDEISKNASAAPGSDKEGVTALINSALNLNPSSWPESFCLDVMLHPTTAAGDRGLDVMYSLLNTYMHGGGMSIQFNIFDKSLLRDAQKHPEKYESLQVRVCGWNVLWNNLSRREQEAYITRAESIQ